MRRLTAVTVGIDRPLLSSGLVLVDTPGVGGIGSVHHAATVGDLPQSHAVLFVTDVSQELTAAELRFLRTVQELCPTVVLVLTKIDLYRHWMRIAELDHAHLQRAGVDVEMIAVSSELRTLAAASGDQALNDESGYPALVGLLGRVVANAEQLALDAVVTHVASAVDQMRVTAVARRDALVDPENAAALLERLRDTKERADALRERSSKWQVLLQDGFQDIASDVEFDLRRRSRAVLHEAEAALDEGDPAKSWEPFEEWLRERLAGEAMENYALFVRRAKEVAATVGEHFDLAESEIVSAREVAAPVDVVGALAVDAEFTVKKAKGLGAAFTKSYGGVLMFTMLPAIMGLAVPLPVGLVGGALLGGLGYREERKRQLERRRQEAKTAVRRAVDEFNLHVGKDSRDAIRHVQRELRTAWSDRVSELQRSAAAALSAAQAEAKGGESDAGARERIESDLAVLQRLQARIEDLRAHLERTRTAPAPATEAPAAEVPA
jgi:hypothetical protein